MVQIDQDSLLASTITFSAYQSIFSLICIMANIRSRPVRTLENGSDVMTDSPTPISSRWSIKFFVHLLSFRTWKCLPYARTFDSVLPREVNFCKLDPVNLASESWRQRSFWTTEHFNRFVRVGLLCPEINGKEISAWNLYSHNIKSRRFSVYFIIVDKTAVRPPES